MALAERYTLLTTFRRNGAPVATWTWVVTGAGFETIHARVAAKYGFMTRIKKLLNTIGGIVKRKPIPYGDIGVVVTPAA